MVFTQDIVVLGVNSWTFEGKSGVSVHYLGKDNLNDENRRGLSPQKVTVEKEVAMPLIMNNQFPVRVKVECALVATSGKQVVQFKNFSVEKEGVISLWK